MSRRAVIVGGGLGGLAAALRLRARDWEVTVYEAGPTFGGKMNRWSSEGFIFDTGPSLITMPWVFANLFHAAGACLEDHVEFVRLESLAEYVYPDGERFRYTSSLPEWIRTLERVAPEDKDGFFRFLELGARLWEVSRRTFLCRTPYDPPGARDWEVLRYMPWRYGWGNYHRTVAEHFINPRLQQLFDRYPTYVGSSPYLAPATLALIPYLEFAFGGWYVRGGLYTLVEALVGIAERLGVAMCANAPVLKIEQERGRVTGVRLASGQRIPADVVVMNGDAATLPDLLGAGDLRAASRSMSGFVMLFGMRSEMPQLAANTVFFSADYRREFSQIFNERRFPDDPTVYVNAPSRLDRTLVPDGRGETLFVMANAPARTDQRTDQWTDAEICVARTRVMARLRCGGFEIPDEEIAVEDVWTPRRIEERYRMPGGAIYGTDSHGWRNAFLRPRNKHQKVGGLYLVGGSTHPGGGTPTVLLSAEITCNLIAKHEQG